MPQIGDRKSGQPSFASVFGAELEGTSLRESIRGCPSRPTRVVNLRLQRDHLRSASSCRAVPGDYLDICQDRTRFETGIHVISVGIGIESILDIFSSGSPYPHE
ncbi:hypothetical protein P8C59_008940 [Phyllachora maydis]|uniref:Uncharacterized protein n=1 Tax=Phyllachora maydis TaxID=1825666 RepID=A0AAD9IDG8_9PEZI|nr:hypothetical protein P8C59_008940 [Phyllachora maydis]